MRKLLVLGMCLAFLTFTALAVASKPVLTSGAARAAIGELATEPSTGRGIPVYIHSCWRLARDHIRCDVTFEIVVLREDVSEATGEVLVPAHVVSETPIEALADVGLKGVTLQELP